MSENDRHRCQDIANNIRSGKDVKYLLEKHRVSPEQLRSAVTELRDKGFPDKVLLESILEEIQLVSVVPPRDSQNIKEAVINHPPTSKKSRSNIHDYSENQCASLSGREESDSRPHLPTIGSSSTSPSIEEECIHTEDIFRKVNNLTEEEKKGVFTIAMVAFMGALPFVSYLPLAFAVFCVLCCIIYKIFGFITMKEMVREMAAKVKQLLSSTDAQRDQAEYPVNNESPTNSSSDLIIASEKAASKAQNWANVGHETPQSQKQAQVLHGEFRNRIIHLMKTSCSKELVMKEFDLSEKEFLQYCHDYCTDGSISWVHYKMLTGNRYRPHLSNQKAMDIKEQNALICPDNGKFGKDFVECPMCSKENINGSQFCGFCGSSLITKCPVCNSSNNVGTQFCNGCGREVNIVTKAGYLEDKVIAILSEYGSSLPGVVLRSPNIPEDSEQFWRRQFNIPSHERILLISGESIMGSSDTSMVFTATTFFFLNVGCRVQPIGMGWLNKRIHKSVAGVEEGGGMIPYYEFPKRQFRCYGVGTVSLGNDQNMKFTLLTAKTVVAVLVEIQKVANELLEK